ncbi:MAG: hypothetical protein HC849_19375 [Oscillatoriales cyanobacterium RU_3_3]|nr:hypothetical protein [Oscillatoriales cyanobacterium RU_3_3]
MINGKSQNLPETCIIYDGSGEPPQLPRDRSILLLPNLPNAEPFSINKTVTYRHNYYEGHVQLTLKLQPITARKIIVTNQLSEATDRTFCRTNEVIEGVYRQLLLGRASREETVEFVSEPHTGIEVLLLDAKESFSVKSFRVTLATIAALRQLLTTDKIDTID